MKYSLIFDMDGVLVDSEPVILAAAIAGLSECGINAKPEDFIPFIGAGEDRFIGGVAEKYGLKYKIEMKRRVYEIYLEIVDEKLKTYEGVGEMLDKLKNDGWIMALASSADRVKIDANLKVAKIPRDVFATVISGEDVVNKKPDPEIFLTAASRIDIPAENCIVVEDAVNGINAAHSAGMKCIAISSSFTRELLRKENPYSICDKTTDIYSVVKKLWQTGK